MNKKNIILGILLIGCIAAFVGYKIYNKPHVDVLETTPDVVITANNLLQDFSKDETKANAKYLDKIIEVKGQVASSKVKEGKAIIALKTNDDFGTILCHLSKKSTEKMKALKQGENIKIKGICTGYLMDVVLVKSEIIN